MQNMGGLEIFFTSVYGKIMQTIILMQMIEEEQTVGLEGELQVERI